MTLPQNVLTELEDAIAGVRADRRAEALGRVADLFANGAAHFSSEQVALFDDVMSRLVAEVDNSVRAMFGRRFATDPRIPPRTIRVLALDDTIEVAGPVLLRAIRLDENTLVEGARTKSQDHLFAISGRQRLSPAVTDVLVERGDRRIVIGTAANLGAEFSEFGYSTLVTRSHDDEALAVCVWSRPEIPRQHLLRLFAEASEVVRAKLETADRRKGKLIRDIVARASDQLQAQVRAQSAEYEVALSHVQSLHDAGELSESRLSAFAHAGKFDETTIALSMMCDLPIGVVERTFVDDRSEQIIVMAKALGLSWETTKAILLVQAGTNGTSTHALEQSLATFTKLKSETAKKALQFYRLRDRAMALS